MFHKKAKASAFTGWEVIVTPYKILWDDQGLKEFVHNALLKPNTVAKDKKRIMDMYTNVYNFVISDGADVSGLQQALQFAMIDRTAALQSACRGSSSRIELFANFIAGWRFWKVTERIFKTVFNPLDKIWLPMFRYHVQSKSCELSNATMTIPELFSTLWRQNVAVPLTMQMKDLALDFLRQEHNGNTENSVGLTACMSCFTRELNYESVAARFENAYMEETQKFYEEVKKKIVMQHDIYLYVNMVTEVHEREMKNARLRLRDCRLNEFSEIFHKCFVAGNEDMFESAFIPSLRSSSSECHSIYKMIIDADRLRRDGIVRDQVVIPAEGRKSAKENLVRLFQRFVRVKLQEVIDEDAAVSVSKGSDGTERFAEVVLAEYSHFSKMVQTAFEDDSEFRLALEQTISDVLNSVNSDDKSISKEEFINRVAVALARYTDKLLHKRKHPFSDEEIEARQRGVITLLSKFSSKDLFIRCYEKFFAQRVFSNSSVGVKQEVDMIQKLCAANGASYGVRLRTMIQDFNSNTELMKDFHASRNGIPQLDVFAVNASNWPIKSGSSDAVVLPDSVKGWMDSYNRFYATQCRDRKLEHLPHLSRAEVTYNITDKRSVNLLLSALQVSMLSSFSRSRTKMTLSAIEMATKISTSTIRRQVKPLIINGLLKTSDLSLSSDDVEVWLNPDFTAPEGVDQVSMMIDAKDDFRLHQMATQQSKDSDAASASALGGVSIVVEGDEAKDSGMMTDSEIAGMVEKERQFVLQAAVMRTMKDKRRMQYPDLQKRVTAVLSDRFQVLPTSFKTVVASLTELGFISYDTASNRIEYIP